MIKRRVLITGATGFVGRWVVQRGLQKGEQIICAGRRNPGLSGLTYVPLDLKDPKSIRTAILDSEPDVVFHLAASGVIEGSSDSAELMQVNAEATSVLLECLSDKGRQPLVILAGSGFEYGDLPHPISEDSIERPVSPYGRSKLAATRAAESFSDRLRILVLRIFGVYGPGENEKRLIPYAIRRMVEGRSIDLSPGQQIRDFAYVEDVANTFWTASKWLENNRLWNIVNVGSGRSLTIRTLLMELEKLMSAKGFAAQCNWGAKDYRPDEFMSYVPNVSRLDKICGRLPTDLHSGLAKTIDVFLRQLSE